jgi:hypothetical protein
MTTVVTIDIVERGRALVAGPGFAGHVAVVYGERTAVTRRPTYKIALTDDTAEHYDDTDREPMAPVTRSPQSSFPAMAVDLARRLAAHYGHTDVRIELDDETHSYRLPTEV